MPVTAPPMPIKTIRAGFPGSGSPTGYGNAVGVPANIGTTSVIISTATVPSATMTPLSKGISIGVIRVRTSSVGTLSTSKVGPITATDGTTTVQLYGGDSAGSTAGAGVDEVIEFCSNLTLTSFNVAFITTVANCTCDVEIAGSL